MFLFTLYQPNVQCCCAADEEHLFIDFFVSNITPHLAGSKINREPPTRISSSFYCNGNQLEWPYSQTLSKALSKPPVCVPYWDQTTNMLIPHEAHNQGVDIALIHKTIMFKAISTV